MAKGIKIDGWLDRKAAAEHIGLSEYWLEKHAGQDLSPPYIQHGRKVWYRREDLDRWLSDQNNIEATGAGGRTALDNLWDMGRKRRVNTPNVVELNTQYVREHGEPVRAPMKKRQIWDKLCKTFDAKQRKLLDEMQAANA